MRPITVKTRAGPERKTIFKRGMGSFFRSIALNFWLFVLVYRSLFCCLARFLILVRFNAKPL